MKLYNKNYHYFIMEMDHLFYLLYSIIQVIRKIYMNFEKLKSSYFLLEKTVERKLRLISPWQSNPCWLCDVIRPSVYLNILPHGTEKWRRQGCPFLRNLIFLCMEIAIEGLLFDSKLWIKFIKCSNNRIYCHLSSKISV